LGDGPGLAPSRQSLSLASPPELALVVQAHGGTDGQGRKRVWMEAAEGMSASRALRLGLGRPEVLVARVEEGRLWAQWRRRVGKDEIGRAEGPALERDVWTRAVLRCLDPAIMDAVRRALKLLALERCLRAGAWVEPPETPEAWLLRRLESFGTPPDWPAIPLVPAPSDPDLLSRIFPEQWNSPDGTWRLDWDVWKGKVGWTAPAGVKAKAKPRVPAPPGWR